MGFASKHAIILWEMLVSRWVSAHLDWASVQSTLAHSSPTWRCQRMQLGSSAGKAHVLPLRYTLISKLHLGHWLQASRVLLPPCGLIASLDNGKIPLVFGKIHSLGSHPNWQALLCACLPNPNWL